jgi:hypothetical protein
VHPANEAAGHVCETVKKHIKKWGVDEFSAYSSAEAILGGSGVRVFNSVRHVSGRGGAVTQLVRCTRSTTPGPMHGQK